MEPLIAARLSAVAPGAELVLDYLTWQDEPWLSELLAECGRYGGRKLVELSERLSEPLGVPSPKHKRRGAVHTLLRLLPEPPSRSPAPRELRARLFRSAAAQPAPRADVLERVAAELCVDVAALERALFSDLAGERRVGAVPSDLTASRLALLVNQELVHGHLKRAHELRLAGAGDDHGLLRQARRLGLICVVREKELVVSGPFTLFRRTELYGRALASLLRYAARGPRFQLFATCEPRGRGRCTLRIGPDTPIFAESEPTAFDTRARTRLLRDLQKLAPQLQLVADPSPLPVGDELLFPDLELVDPRHDAPYRFELIGFWTSRHIAQRLAQLGNIERYVLCVDEARSCSEGELPNDSRLLRYRTRLGAAALLAHLRL